MAYSLSRSYGCWKSSTELGLQFLAACSSDSAPPLLVETAECSMICKRVLSIHNVVAHADDPSNWEAEAG